MSAYTDRLRQIAIEEGVDPDVALQVVKSEGGFSDPYQRARTPGEYSVGGLQLNMRRGVGAEALKAGIDPTKDWEAAYRFGLRWAKEHGWLGDWMGARKIGLADRAGLGGGGGDGGVTLTSTPLKHVGGAGSGPEYFQQPVVSPSPVVAEPAAPKTWFEGFKERLLGTGDEKEGEEDGGGAISDIVKGITGESQGRTATAEQISGGSGSALQASMAEDAGRYQAAQALMSSILANKRRLTGLSLNSIPRGVI